MINKNKVEKKKGCKGMRKIHVMFFVAVLILTMFLSGCLGEHETCPDCGGLGRNPWTLFITGCSTCDGDGEVGLFIPDEDVEDMLSYIIALGVILIIIFAVIKSIFE